MCLAVPGRVEAIQAGPLRMATVDFAGIRKEASLVYVPEAAVGDYVIVHVGFAISRLDEAAARAVFAELARYDAAARQGGEDLAP